MDIKRGEAVVFSVEVEGRPETIKEALFIMTRDLEENSIKKSLGRGIEYAGKEIDSFFYNVSLTERDTAMPGQYFFELKLFTAESFSSYKGLFEIGG